MKIDKTTLDSNGEKVSHTEIKIHENGKHVIILNPEKSEFHKIHMDGGVIKNSTCCDYLVIKSDYADLLVELKGIDVAHAVKQICTTADIWHESGLRSGMLSGVVVCTRRPNPRFSSTMQRQQMGFYKKFKCFIHIVDKNRSFSFSKFFGGTSLK